VSQEQLWAPWRLGYIQGEAPPRADPVLRLPGADPDCFLCRGVADPDDRRNLVVARGAVTVTILNRYPYNNGHLLIAPQRHKGRLDELTAEEHLECQQTLARLVGMLEQRMHWHLVPRWNGDTNFMPTLAGVKVIPQSLDALWELLQ